jgi:hypothetical protein
VSPEQAAAWLATSRQGRFNREKLARYAAAMRSGRWRVGMADERPMTIKAGRLHNGNHRCAAIVESGATVTVLVREEA